MDENSHDNSFYSAARRTIVPVLNNLAQFWEGESPDEPSASAVSGSLGVSESRNAVCRLNNIAQFGHVSLTAVFHSRM